MTDGPQIKIGMVGLGRMGANMVRRLRQAGQQCRVYDVSEQAVTQLVGEGAEGAGSLADLVAGLAPPRTVWLMLPAAVTGSTVTELLDLLEPGDAIVDGGNSSYRDDIDRAQVAASQGIDLVDCGTSGGVWGLMAAYAEGLDIIRAAGAGRGPQAADAETAPLRDPQYYPFDDIDLTEVAEVWRRGSVIRSWLLDLTAQALLADPHLDQFAGRISDSGEGRWTSIAAIDEGVPANLLTAALYSRFASRGSALFADKVESAQRLAFGGHVERKGS